MKSSIASKSLALLLGAVAMACGGGGGGGAGGSAPVVVAPSENFEENTSEATTSITSFKALGQTEWNETRVRKILHVFAFGSAATDEQIKAWASMDPKAAVEDILSLNAIHPKLSPEASSPHINGELSSLSKVWSVEHKRYGMDDWNGPAEVWLRATLDPGLNPVRQRIGLMETNDHMAVNLESGVQSRQVFRYYDDVLNTLASGQPYQKVVNTAALSAAVATQYNHRKNRFVDGAFKGNEDFAREYHQLYFGILGNTEQEHHEMVNIRNTAKALTDIQVENVKIGDKNVLTDMPMYGQDQHYPAALSILHQSVSGGNAHDKISLLSESAIQNPESLDTLPKILLGNLSDPNMSDGRAQTISAAWKELPNKSLLGMLRSYAASSTFHDPTRLKYWNVLERWMIIAQRFYLTRFERENQNMLSGWELIQLENGPFRPIHDVFGSQKGLEAAESSHVFAKAWENSTNRVWAFTRSEDTSKGWRKDWGTVAPKSAEGKHVAAEVGAWLWQRFIADGGKNYGPLEKAQVLSLLVSGKDYGLFADSENASTVYDLGDFSAPAHTERLNDLGVSLLKLEDSDLKQRRIANERVGLAIAFIVATPYMFAQEG